MAASREQPGLTPPTISPKSEKPSDIKTSASSSANQIANSNLEILDQSLIIVKSIIPPVENKLRSQFLVGGSLPKNTFHQVSRAIEITLDEVREYFFKVNPPSTKVYANYMSELEAVCAAYYKFLAPHLIANTWAVHNEKQEYIGVLSEELPGFKSTAVNPLTEEDLKNDNLLNDEIYWLYDQCDAQIRELENKSHLYKRKIKRLEDIEIQIKARIDLLQEAGTPDNLKEIDALIKEAKANADMKTQIFSDQCINTKNLIELYKSIETKTLNKDDIRQYRIIKGLAIALTTSYIFMEDDLHQNNFSKDGKRIDFDMSLWPILYDFKDASLIDLSFRKPAKNAFDITAYDIEHFPNLKNATPFYWPTNKTNILSKTTTTILTNFVSLSVNAYSPQMNSIFQKLEKHPVFIYHKYATLLKYIMSDAETYRSIAMLHMRKDRFFEAKPVIDILTQVQGTRLQQFKDTLIQIPEFATFIEKHGSRIISNITNEISIRNAHYAKLAEATQTVIEDLKKQSTNFAEINDVLLKSLQVVGAEIAELNKQNIDPARSAKLTQKVEEKTIKSISYQTNDVRLKEIAVEVNAKEAALKIYQRQNIDIKYIETRFCTLHNRLTSQDTTDPLTPESEKPPRHPLGKSSPALTSNPIVRYPHFDFTLGKSRAESYGGNTCDYSKLQKKVISEMEKYQSPSSWLALGGMFRTHSDVAENIKKFAEKLQPASNDFASNREAACKLKEKLETERRKLGNDAGSMSTTLSTLLKDDAWNITKTITSPLLKPQIASPPFSPLA